MRYSLTCSLMAKLFSLLSQNFYNPCINQHFVKEKKKRRKANRQFKNSQKRTSEKINILLKISKKKKTKRKKLVTEGNVLVKIGGE